MPDETRKCEKCRGAGWLRGSELNDADEATQMDTLTKYLCDECGGSGPVAAPVDAAGERESKPFIDTALLAAYRRAFDYPNQANLDTLVAEAKRDALARPPQEAVAWVTVHTRTGERHSLYYDRSQAEEQQAYLARMGITETRIEALFAHPAPREAGSEGIEVTEALVENMREAWHLMEQAAAAVEPFGGDHRNRLASALRERADGLRRLIPSLSAPRARRTET